jgi:hypothetical protein
MRLNSLSFLSFYHSSWNRVRVSDALRGRWKHHYSHTAVTEDDYKFASPNRVAGGFSPPAPTAPRMRVRTGRFLRM